MLEDGAQFDILTGNLLGYNGAIYENLVTDIFSKMECSLHYFLQGQRDGARFRDQIPQRMRARRGEDARRQRKEPKALLKHPERCHVKSTIKLADRNAGRVGAILTIPRCMAFVLTSS